MGRLMGSAWLREWGRRGRSSEAGGVGGNYRQYMDCVYGMAWIDTTLAVRIDNYE